MTTMQKKRRLSPRRRRLRLRPINDGQPLTAEQLAQMWAAYVADHRRVRLRNRLVEHYLPWVQSMAESIAKTMGLRDEENAVGEVLVALVESIVPGYDGKSGFESWAGLCAERKLVDQQRAEERAARGFSDVPLGPARLARIPARTERVSDLNFSKFTAELSDSRATAVWLRYYRGLTLRAIAEVLNVSPGTVNTWTQEAMAALKKRWADYTSDELPTY